MDILIIGNDNPEIVAKIQALVDMEYDVFVSVVEDCEISSIRVGKKHDINLDGISKFIENNIKQQPMLCRRHGVDNRR